MYPLSYCWKKISIIPLVITFFLSFSALGAFGTTSFSQSIRPSTVDSSAEQDFLNRTNALRASKGLGPLKTNSELLAKARSWSQTQASSGSIFHSTLTNGVTQNWHRLGENVGMGPDVVSIHNALVNSQRHYDNLVDPGFTDVGIGVIKQGNVIFVTQVFMQLMPETKSTSAPKATPAQPTKQTGKVAAVPSNKSNPQPKEPEVLNIPLKTASEQLAAIIQKISVLES